MTLRERIRLASDKRKANRAGKKGSGPNKSGNDSYTPSASTKPKAKPSKPTISSRMDNEDAMYERGIARKKAEAKAKTEAAKAKTNKPKPRYTGTDKTSVENKGKTKASGYKSYYSKDELKSKQVAKGNTRAIANRKAKGAVKSGETYIFTDSKGKKQTATKP